MIFALSLFSLSNKKFEEIEKELDDAVDENANLQAAETAVPIDFKAHDTFRSIAEKFRKELEMLDELGIIDKNSSFCSFVWIPYRRCIYIFYCHTAFEHVIGVKACFSENKLDEKFRHIRRK